MGEVFDDQPLDRTVVAGEDQSAGASTGPGPIQLDQGRARVGTATLAGPIDEYRGGDRWQRRSQVDGLGATARADGEVDGDEALGLVRRRDGSPEGASATVRGGNDQQARRNEPILQRSSLG